MKISLSTGWKFDMPFSLKKSFQIASRLGFDGVELVINGEYCFHKIDFIKKLSNEFNLPILSVHCPLVKSFLFKSMAWVDRTFEIANALKAGLVVIHSYRLKPYYSKNGLVLLDYLKQKKEEYPNIKITLENFRYSRKNEFDNLEDLLKVSKKNDFGLTFDTTHIGFTDYHLSSAYELFKYRIQNIHFSDWKDNHEHLVPGQGAMPINKLLKELKKDQYNGLLTLELLFLPFTSYKKAYRSCKQSIDFIKRNYE